MLYESSGLGSKVQKFLRCNADPDSGLPDKERNFIKSLGVKKEIYNDVKNRITKDLLSNKETELNITNLKTSISKNITQYFDIDKDRLNRILEFVMKLNEDNKN